MDKFYFISLKEGLETISLGVHIFEHNLVGGWELSYPQVGAVYIDRVVMRSREAGVLNQYLAFAAGHLYKIGKSGTSASAPEFRLKSKMSVS